jgi:hypothetical protein
MENVQLSQNFWLHEFTVSQKAERMGIVNQPSPAEIKNLKLLCDFILQPLRDWSGNAVYVSSGFRCVVLNKEIGGSKTSDHVHGRAADIDSAIHNVDYFDWIRDNCSFDQLIWEYGTDLYPAWVHCSFRSERKNRGQVLKVYRDNDGVHYVPFD